MSKESIPPISSIPEDLRTMDFSGKTIEEFEVIEKRIGTLFTPDMITEDSAELNDILEEIELLKKELEEKVQKDEPKTVDVSEASAKTARTSGSKEKPRKIETSGSIASSIRTGLGTPIGIDKKSLATGLQWIEEQFRWDKLNDPENAGLKEKLQMRKAEILAAQKTLGDSSQSSGKETADKKIGGLVERANDALTRSLDTLTTDAECKAHLKELDGLMVELSANAEDEEQKAIRAKISEKKDQVYMLGQQIRRGRGSMLDEMKKTQASKVEKISAAELGSKEEELNRPISELSKFRAVHIEILESILKEIDEHAGDEKYADHPDLRSRVVNRIKEVQQYGEDAKEINVPTENQEKFTPEEQAELDRIKASLTTLDPAMSREEYLVLLNSTLANPLVQRNKNLVAHIEEAIQQNSVKGERATQEALGEELAQGLPERIVEEDRAAQEALGEELSKGLPEREAEVVKEAIKKNWIEIAKEKVMGISLKNIAKGIFSKDTAAGIAGGAAMSMAVKAGFQGALGISGMGLGVVAGIVAAPGRRLLGAGWKEVGYRESKKALIRGDAGAILHRVKGQGLDRLNKLSKLDALKLIADRKAQLEKENISEGYDAILDIEKQIIEHGEKIETLKGKDRLDEYLRLAALAEDPKIIEQKAEIEKELAQLSGRRVTKKQLATSALIGAMGGFVGYKVAHWIGGYFDHSGTESAQQAIQAKTETAAAAKASTADTLAHRAADLKPQVVSAPATPTLEAPDDVTDSFQGLEGGDIAAAKIEAAHGAAAVKAHAAAQATQEKLEAIRSQLNAKPLEVIQTHGVAPVETISVDTGYTPDPINTLGVTESDYLNIDASHTTVADLYQHMANASESGPYTHVGIAVAHMEPTAAEMDMSVKEFMSHRAGLASVVEKGLDTPELHVPMHTPQIHESVLSEPSHEPAPEVSHDAVSKPSVQPTVEKPVVAPQAEQVPATNSPIATPEVVNQGSDLDIKQPPKLSFWDRLMGRGTIKEATGKSLNDFVVPKGMIPQIDAQPSFISASDPVHSFVEGSAMHLSSEPIDLSEGVSISEGEKGMFDWVTGGFVARTATAGVGAVVLNSVGRRGVKALKEKIQLNKAANAEDGEFDKLSLKEKMDILKAMPADERQARMVELLNPKTAKRGEKLSAATVKVFSKLTKEGKYEEALTALLSDYSKFPKGSAQRKNIGFISTVVGTFDDKAYQTAFNFRNKLTEIDKTSPAVENIASKIETEEESPAAKIENVAEAVESFEAERFTLPSSELKNIIQESIPKNIKIKKLDLVPDSAGFKLDGQLDAGFIGGKINISAVIGNSKDGIEIKKIDVEANGLAKPRIMANLDKLTPAIKEYFEQKYKKPIESIQIEGSDLVVTTKASA